MQFEELGLSPQALQAVVHLGYSTPTPVQEQAIPLTLEGRDLIAAAKTGTGKTAAFALPSMDCLGHAKKKQGPLMLVITPTRELAQQIAATCQSIAQSTHHRILSVVGGLSYEPQIQQLKQGVDVLIATPGRLIDLMEQQALRLSDITTLILDEADRMLDMGFWPSVKRIIAACPTNRQTLLFSATIDKSIMRSVGKLLNNPAMIEIAHKGDTADTVKQYVISVAPTIKASLLKALISNQGSQRAIVFTRTRSRADATCRRLKRAGFSAEAIHSNRTQNQRRRALDSFASGKIGILVATDVLARGIDVEEVDYVVNYDLPSVPEDYIHRIGRTGRAGATGKAFSLVSPDAEDALKAIEKLIKKPIPEMKPDFFDMEEAEKEAQAKAQRAEARKDPDIQQAIKEQTSRQRKKSRARERAKAEAEVAEKRKRKNTRKKANGKPSSKHTTKSKSADLRPGRSHRADIARQRARKNH